MQPDRWNKITEIFHAALALSPEQRPSYIRAAADGDPDIQEEVEILLEQHSADDDFLARSPFSGEPAGLANYKLLDKLGEGGMGEVYTARDLHLDRVVAIKFLTSAANSEAVARFLQEARTASALDHVNICTIYTAGSDDRGHPYIVMAYYAGEGLAARIARGRVPSQEACGIALQVARGLAKAHSARIIHRDIKPGNIILTTDGVVKILDFGIAKIAGQKNLTTEGHTIGTLGYMSPEQARGQSVDPRTDIWSLGVVLVEMLTGKRPFERENHAASLFAILHDAPPPLSSEVPGIEPALDHLARRMLSKDPAGRPASMGEVVQELEAILAGSPVPPAAAIAPTAPTLAVLPFAFVGGSEEGSYFADGLTDEIITSLSHIREIRVLSRTTSFQYKGYTLDIRELGAQLGVAAVLEGSVRTAGNRVRISARLFNVADGYDLWSEKFDRDLADILAVQDEIAQAITAALKLKLRAPRPPVRPVNPEAYRLVLQGRQWTRAWSPGTFARGMDCFRQALRLDPHFAAAHAAIAEAHFQQATLGQVPHRDVWPEARAAAEAALTIDPANSDALAARGLLHILELWDWDAARRCFEAALQSNPGDARSRCFYALFYLVPQGLFGEALANAELACHLDPLLPATHIADAAVALAADRFKEAIKSSRRALEIAALLREPPFVIAAANLALARPDEALAALREPLAREPGNTMLRSVEVAAHAAIGDAGRASKLRASLVDESSRRHVPATHLAIAHTALGDKDSAFAALDAAAEERAVLLVFLAVFPLFDSLRPDPRYRRLLDRIGLG